MATGTTATSISREVYKALLDAGIRNTQISKEASMPDDTLSSFSNDKAARLLGYKLSGFSNKFPVVFELGENYDQLRELRAERINEFGDIARGEKWSFLAILQKGEWHVKIADAER